MVGNAQGLVCVLFYQEDGCLMLLVNLFYHIEYKLDDQRRQPHGGLIQ